MTRLLLVGILTISTGFSQAIPFPGRHRSVAYTGPGNVVSGASIFWSLRAYDAAHAGQRVAEICNTGDVHCADVNSLANGDFDLATVTAAPFSCGTCTVKTLYDLTLRTDICANFGVGAPCDVTQATEALRPTLVLNMSGGKPGLAFSGSQQLLTPNGIPAGTAIAQPFTLSAVAKRTGGFTSEGDLFMVEAGGGLVLAFWTSGNDLIGYAGNVFTFAQTDSTLHAIQWVANGGTSTSSIDGVDNNGDSGTTTILGATHIFIGGRTSGATLTGSMGEEGVWPVGFTSGNKSAMKDNQKAYWGF